MNGSEHYLPARYYALLASTLVQQGVNLPEILRQAGVAPSTLNAPDGQLTPEEVERLGTVVFQVTGRSDLGFMLGQALKLSSHDILGYALMSAPTLDAAIRLLARYFSLITPTYCLRYESGPEGGLLRFSPTLPLSPPVLNFHLEAIAVALHEHLRVLLGVSLLPANIQLSFEAPPHAARYRELTGATVQFGVEGLPGARIFLPRDWLGRSLALADSHSLQMAEARCAGLLTTITRSNGLAEWTRMMLSEAADAGHVLPELARILNVSPRTLERRLAAEGLSYRTLANEARHHRACTLLKARRLNVTQIAYQLGYGDAANFSRAFRKHAGVPPSQWRQTVVDIPSGMP